jgi:hypothetical protein
MMGGGQGSTGQLAQRANPQANDPMQNMNNSGFPNAPRKPGGLNYDSSGRIMKPQAPPQQAPPANASSYGIEVKPWDQTQKPSGPVARPFEQPIPYQVDPAKMPKPGSQYGGYANADMQAYQEYVQNKFPSPGRFGQMVPPEEMEAYRQRVLNDPEAQRLRAAALANQENVHSQNNIGAILESQMRNYRQGTGGLSSPTTPGGEQGQGQVQPFQQLMNWIQQQQLDAQGRGTNGKPYGYGGTPGGGYQGPPLLGGGGK